ncbi:hypothetical protein C8Q70DRAFT_333982 [Cubamyces menziesii]|nr:hypothetical protein C8Q70DRAFT_333982 [Cubamyces menziesii]
MAKMINCTGAPPTCDKALKCPFVSVYRTVMSDCSLRMLDGDCLHRIFSLLRPCGGLRPLSLTCKWIRSACMIVLFDECSLMATRLRDAEGIPPTSLWPYIRRLKVMEQFAYYPAPTELDFPPETLYLTSPRVVATCHEEVLRTALCAMPRLDTIIILDSKNFGVPWVIFATILSTPQLRVFEIRGRIHRAFDRLAEPPYQSFAPLRAFRYVPDHIDTPVRIGPIEKRMLVILLEQVSVTLETLVLPSESVPLRLMSLWEWPNLRELRLRGDSRPIHRCRTPLVSVFGRMPRLHTLSLLLAHSKKSPLGPLWPAHSECKSLPWAELKSLTLSWIHPDDLIFAHLPPTLRHLSFRAWPRLFIMYYDAHRLWAERVHWKLKAPKSAQISRILPLCPSANLERIELEYVADSAELELLRRIPDIAPRLEWLQIIRYRSAWDLSPVSVVRGVG